MNAPAERKKLRVLAIVHPDLVPPAEGERDDTALWKMEYDVVHTLRELGHEVLVVGVGDELGVIRKAVADFAPHIVFNLVEGFDEGPKSPHTADFGRVRKKGSAEKGTSMFFAASTHPNADREANSPGGLAATWTVC